MDTAVSLRESLDPERILWLYQQMQRIRQFEEKARKELAAGRIPGFIHSSIGEESTAVGVCANLREDDAIATTHRGHGHALAKGVDMGRLFAELQGKETGVCRGKGGSMHVADASKGMFGANGIVGGGLPLATGLALGFKYKGTDRVSVAFFGDGAANQGTFHESLNLAAIWKLPAIYFCENNGYGEDTPVEYHMACKNVSDRAAAYAVPGIIVNGSNVLEVYNATKHAVERARKGEGPTLIEAKVYYKVAHYEGMPAKYKTKDYLRLQEERDPITLLADYVLSTGISTVDRLKQIETSALQEVEAAWQYSLNSPLPRPEETTEDVYVKY